MKFSHIGCFSRLRRFGNIGIRLCFHWRCLFAGGFLIAGFRMLMLCQGADEVLFEAGFRMMVRFFFRIGI